MGRIIRKTLLAALACLPGVLYAQDAKTVLDAASTAIGATGLNSFQVSGRGFDYLFGQAYDGDSAWPRFNVSRYKLTIDYTVPAIREERTRSQAQNPPLGGGDQPINEQRQVWALSGNYAWNLNAQGTATPSGLERDLRTAVESRQTQILLTPQGFIKAAQTANATVATKTVGSVKKTVISFTAPNKVKLEGTLNEQNLVERIETWFDTPVLGDTLFEAVFSDYKDFGGVKFPTHIVQREAGYPVLDVVVTEVKPNGAEPIEVPENIKEAKGRPAVEIKPVKIAEGTWIISGEDYHASKSIAVEFRDYILVVEAPDSEERSIAVIDAIKKIIPNKPIKYIINTHTHFDHSGGLRTYAAEGAAIVTWSGNLPYYEEVWANPRTIRPDRLSKSGRKPVFEGLDGNRIFSDGSQEVVVYHYAGNFHNPGMLAVFLPKAKALIEADSFSPPANPSDPTRAIPNLVQFYGVVQRLGLDVDQIVPIHGRTVTLDEARKVIDENKDAQLWKQ
jgi:glyoxylase-like metal-dependent hydrolase (beta-lactamase superfamily II)